LVTWSVYDSTGQRKYLNEEERESFLLSATRLDIDVHSFCWMLAVTGCRISEGLALTGRSIDFSSGHVIIECLKKRGKKVFRTVPLPPELLNLLKEAIANGTLGRERLWPWSRQTGYRRVKEVMRAAQVVGSHATPKGLRHAFGVCAIQSNVPLNLIQRWLGHSDIKTTAIYASAMGPEEREFASRTWKLGFNSSKKSGSPKTRRSRIGAVAEPTVKRTSIGRCDPPVSEVRQNLVESPAFCLNSSLLKLAEQLNYRITMVVNTFTFDERPDRLVV